jgi:hypothetical protein
MQNDLSKKDKKIARTLIDKGIHIEFERGLKEFDVILQEWKNGNVETRETYRNLYKAIREFDKYIALMYDGVGGSQYFDTVVHQLASELYDVSEADAFNLEVKDEILKSAKRRKEYWEENQKRHNE